MVSRKNTNEVIEANPLAKYYRLPGVHVQLPTRGAFMPAGSVEFTMNGDVPVYPMRAADEILLKSPDALMSGYAIEELIKSCVPAIREPRTVSTPDLDVLLLAIRAATYGGIISLSPTCPECQEVQETKRNLSYLMGTMTFIEPENIVRLTDEIVAYVRPYTMLNATALALAAFEEARKLQAVENVEGPERGEQINQSMQRLATLSTNIMADSVLRVVVPTGDVRDPLLIHDFIANISKPWTDQIQAKLDEINARGIEKKYDIQCAACGHQWQADIEFNPASFFGQSSSA